METECNMTETFRKLENNRFHLYEEYSLQNYRTCFDFFLGFPLSSSHRVKCKWYWSALKLVVSISIVTIQII